jgi:nicotinic acid mononucleotide adenylyltransferase
VTGFGDDAIFLVGADQFAKFLTWREPDEILEHVRLGVATRPGYPREKLDPVSRELRRPSGSSSSTWSRFRSRRATSEAARGGRADRELVPPAGRPRSTARVVRRALGVS